MLILIYYYFLKLNRISYIELIKILKDVLGLYILVIVKENKKIICYMKRKNIFLLVYGNWKFNIWDVYVYVVYYLVILGVVWILDLILIDFFENFE